MFPNQTSSTYASRSARDIELESRDRERRLALLQAIENAKVKQPHKRKGLLASLATILFS